MRLLKYIYSAFLTASMLTLFANIEQGYVVFNQGNEFYVKTEVSGEITFSSTDAASSIQWALDNVSGSGINAGEVFIEPGKYYLYHGIIVGSNLWLHGSGPETELVISGQIMEGIAIQDASMSKISDLTLVNIENELNSTGILLERSISCKVINTSISGFKTGIRNAGESAMTLIDGNRIINNDRGINIQNGGGVIARWLPIVVANNEVDGNNVGISCGALCVNIVDNKVINSSRRAIQATHNSILINGNYIDKVGGDFAIFGDGAEFNCTNNVIKNSKGGGIRTRKRWGTVSNNQIINSGTKENPAIGILVVSDDSNEGPAESKVIFNNTIYNDNGIPLQYGIKEDGFTNIIAENKVGKVSEDIVSSIGKGTISHNNSSTK